VPTREQIISFDDAPPPQGADPWVVRSAPRPIEVVEYRESWRADADELAARLAAALGTRALRVEHVGSTAVAGLPAKPIIDLDLTVADPEREAAWLPALEAAGFVLTVREPWWHGHRLLCSDAPAANVHVFGPDSPELVKHLVFRDWLRADGADRERYAAAKRAAAAASTSRGERVKEYNARKEGVVREIYARAFRAAGFLD
jgi:GrpB-like predicted nucleotidyltransferase (UPF0157 family)